MDQTLHCVCLNSDCINVFSCPIEFKISILTELSIITYSHIISGAILINYV